MNKEVSRFLTRLGWELASEFVKEFVAPLVKAAARKVVERMNRSGDAETGEQSSDQPAAPNALAIRDPYEAMRKRLIEVRDGVRAGASKRIDLREYLEIDEPAWKVDTRVWGNPGHKTRKKTVLARLDATIRGFEGGL